MTRGHGLLAAATALLVGCISPGPMRARLEIPAGAEIIIHGRDSGSEDGEIRAVMPAVGNFETGIFVSYPISVVLPPEVSARYGASGEIELRGSLSIRETTATVDGIVVALPLPDLRQDFDNRLSRLLRGETASLRYETIDPTRRGRPVLIEVRLAVAR